MYHLSLYSRERENDNGSLIFVLTLILIQFMGQWQTNGSSSTIIPKTYVPILLVLPVGTTLSEWQCHAYELSLSLYRSGINQERTNEECNQERQLSCWLALNWFAYFHAGVLIQRFSIHSVISSLHLVIYFSYTDNGQQFDANNKDATQDDPMKSKREREGERGA